MLLVDMAAGRAPAPRVAPRDVVAAGGGLVAAAPAIAWLRGRGRRVRLAYASAGLGIAAAIYPAARSGWKPGGAVYRELGGLGAFCALSVVGARSTSAAGSLLLASGWLGHAAFDVHHDSGPDSRIPSWYPAFCAGYDVGMAAGLLARP
jgi:hypothetical protein